MGRNPRKTGDRRKKSQPQRKEIQSNKQRERVNSGAKNMRHEEGGMEGG